MNNNITIDHVKDRIFSLVLSKFFKSDKYDPFKAIEIENITKNIQCQNTASKIVKSLTRAGISEDISTVFDKICEKFKSHNIEYMLYSIDEFFINLETDSIMVGMEWHGMTKMPSNYNFNTNNNFAIVFNGNQHEIRFKICMLDMDLQPIKGDINPKSPGRDIDEPIPHWFIEAQKKRTN